MKKMEYTEFGKTQLRVSRMCLGTWGIGGAGWDSYSDESRMDAIKAAVDCGINFIDTAPATTEAGQNSISEKLCTNLASGKK